VNIGTRASALARRQSEMVAAMLEASTPGLDVRLVLLKTLGDKILDAPLSKIGDKGLFTKELEEALLDGRADIAVHSLKDLPTRLPEGLCVGAILERENPSDVLVSPSGRTLAQLPQGARLGTSSLRRRSQLRAARPDLVIDDLRGNVPTRIDKVERGEYDAILLARAGIVRLGLASKITEVIDPGVILPAVGQGAIAIEIRQGDTRIADLVRGLDHLPTRLAVLAERSLLRRLEGGCQVPIGALGVYLEGRLSLRGLVADLEGGKVIRAEESAAIGELQAVDRAAGSTAREAGSPSATAAIAEIVARAEALGERLAERLLELGAKPILERIFAETRTGGAPFPGAEGDRS
jgi:hydroxymethylbilane synthase